jgi:hypothetical protein
VDSTGVVVDSFNVDDIDREFLRLTVCIKAAERDGVLRTKAARTPVETDADKHNQAIMLPDDREFN